MHLHEFQTKKLLSRYHIVTPQGEVASSDSEARLVAEKIGGHRWIIKAQIHAGGRGKAGGVKVAHTLDEVATATRKLLGKRLVTEQTTAKGLPVHQVLVEDATDIEQEYYLALSVDRASECFSLMVSAAGGMAVEDVAIKSPDAILSLSVSFVIGLQDYHCRRAAFFLGLTGDSVTKLAGVMRSLYRLFVENDANMIEINPLVVTAGGELVAVDAKLEIDDNALFRHKDLASLFDASQYDELEVAASQYGLNYIALDGEVACMVNGAGLAMATMDLIKQQGGMPANFLDVGGGTTADRVAEAFKLILTDSKVKSILVNIFGGIVHCDLIAKGIIQAVKEVKLSVPVTVRLAGTHAEEGCQLLAKSGMPIQVTHDLTEAAKRAVIAAQRSA